MKYIKRFTFIFFIPLVFFTAGCSVGIYDGMRVTNTASTVRPSGWVTSAPTANSKIRVQARLNGNGNWVTLANNIAISNSSSWTTDDGTDLYYWDAGSMAIPAGFWASGTGGSYARLRAQWTTNGSS